MSATTKITVSEPGRAYITPFGVSVTFDCYGTDVTVNAGEFYNCIG